MQESQKKFDDHLIDTISTLQKEHVKDLKKMKAKYLSDGIDTFEVDHELEPFIRHRQIDLTSVYTLPLEGGSHYNASSVGLAPVAEDYRSGKGIKYDIRGVVQLNSGTFTNAWNKNLIGKDINELLGKNYPDKVTGIPVGQKAESIFVVGAVTHGRASDDRTVARVVLNYENGSTKKLLLKAGRHIADWYRPKELPDAFIVWRAAEVGVYEIELNNPEPGGTISTIDLESGKDDAAPFFLAITLD